jgi:hypothetical protein
MEKGKGKMTVIRYLGFFNPSPYSPLSLAREGGLAKGKSGSDWGIVA